MIKEKKKKSKYNYHKSSKQIIREYVRTVMLSILTAIIITTGLAIHARHEMIKDLNNQTTLQKVLDQNQAKELIEKADAIKDLHTKKYSVCLHIGDLYNALGEYEKAQRAYELAIQKAKPSNLHPYYKLICVLVAQEKFDLANAVLDNIDDTETKSLIKFKARSYIVIGDKYYSIGKFYTAAKNYEKANFYYNKFAKKDKAVAQAIQKRIINSYIKTADVMVKMGYNSDAVRYLKKAESYAPENNVVKYKLAIVYSDLDPEKSVEYLEELLKIIPQEIDYNIYGRALMKAAHIADLDNRPTKAKYYRYKIHSIDLYINRKVVYQNDIESELISFPIRKALFKYPLQPKFKFTNVSSSDIVNLTADFVLKVKDRPVETYTTQIADRNNPLFSNGGESKIIPVNFKKTVLTKKELEHYSIDIYIYKDEKYKTPLTKVRVLPNELNLVRQY